jgi:hypothetical protein
MTDTTSIMDLPTDPAAGGGNMNLHAMEQRAQPIQGQQQSPTQAPSGMLDQGTITQLVNGLQQATVAGATQLQSRDIPMNTTMHSNDAQIQPNYVPQPTQGNQDYIRDYETGNNMVNKYNSQQKINDSLEDMYNEIQTPLLLSVLYFLFQLPFFRRILSTYFPILFANDGNYNLNGYLFCSILFGLLFHLLNKLTVFFNTY